MLEQPPDSAGEKEVSVSCCVKRYLAHLTGEPHLHPVFLALIMEPLN